MILLYKGGLQMSILQEYEKIRETIGYEKYDAIDEYLKEICKKDNLDKYFKEINKIDFSSPDFNNEIVQLKNKYNVVLLDDILYKKEEWVKYNNWYNENHLHKKVEVLGIWHTDFDDVRCQAILYQDGKKVGNIIASCEDKKIENLIDDDRVDEIGWNEFAEEVFKNLIYDDFDTYLNLPKISNYSKLLQEIYDDVCSSEASMCYITDEDWKEFYSDEYTDKDFENLKLEVEKYGLKDVVGINDGEYKILGYGDLETRFNDDRRLEVSKDYEGEGGIQL